MKTILVILILICASGCVSPVAIWPDIQGYHVTHDVGHDVYECRHGEKILMTCYDRQTCEQACQLH